MSIVVDAMGSDNHPDPEIKGALNAAGQIDKKIILVGDEKIIRSKLELTKADATQIEIVHAPEVVEMWDKPVESTKKKPANSMAVGIGLLKKERGSAFVTAGNTGGAMFNALRTLGRIKGIQRPALTATIPTQKGKCIVVDIGANADCRPEFLVQFGLMGSIYAQHVLGINNPRVALLSNGEEAGKGNQLVKDTYSLLEKSSLNFKGNIEPKELFAGEADVIITDGFTGNILIKTSEAMGKFITDTLKNELMKSTKTKLGALLAKPAFMRIRSLMDPGEVGAAPLLGINGLVFIGHGRSDAKAMTNAILLAYRATQSEYMSIIRSEIEKNIIGK